MTGTRPWIVVLVLAFLVTSCSGQPTPAPTPAATPIPPIVPQSPNGPAIASGEVVPARKAQLGFPAAGRVRSVTVDVGDDVQSDAVLVVLDTAAAEAAVVQAQAALAQAQAHLAQSKAGPRPQEIAAAQAYLESVQAHLAQLSEGARQEEIAAAEAELAAATAAQRQLFSGPQEEERIAARATLSNAEAALQQAQATYDRVAWRSDVGTLPESLQLQEATNNYEAAKARYDALFADPTAAAVAAARARVQQAQAALDRLQAPATAGQIAEAEAQVRVAQAELDLLMAGTQEEAIAAAEAVVSEAEAALQRAEAELANTELRASFAGTVTALNVNPGEMVQPGQVVLTLADLSGLRVETTDLSERDLAQVSVGQPVTVYVEALDTEVPGQVVRIAPQATVVGGDVVYTVVVELDHQPAGLRWGMSVDVAVD